MPPADTPLSRYPAVGFFLIVVSLAALGMTVVNLRNARSWLLLLSGGRAEGMVTKVEIVTGPDGEVLRRPAIEFTAADGRTVAGTPVVYRPKMSLTKGEAVRVSYSRSNPARLVVHGYDFRIREAAYAVLGVVIAVGIAITYFEL